MQKKRRWFPWAAALLIAALLASAAGALPRAEAGQPTSGRTPRVHRSAGTELRIAEVRGQEPVIGPTSWYDALNDAAGLSWLERTHLLTDRVSLGRVEVLGDNVASVRAMTEGPGGVLYIGTDQSRLWSYDPATDETVDLGMPVPDECNN